MTEERFLTRNAFCQSMEATKPSRIDLSEIARQVRSISRKDPGDTDYADMSGVQQPGSISELVQSFLSPADQESSGRPPAYSESRKRWSYGSTPDGQERRISYEELFTAAERQRRNDQQYTVRYVDKLIDDVYTPDDMIRMIPGLTRDEEAEVRLLVKGAVMDGINRFLEKTHQPCCVFHADHDVLSEYTSIEREVEGQLRGAYQHLKPHEFAKHVYRTVLSSVQTADLEEKQD